MTKGPRLFYVMLVMAALTAPSCTPPSVEPAARQQAPKPSGPQPRVELPPMLKLEATLPPEAHADGHLRVDGLIARRSRYFDKTVKVKGYLVKKVVCPKDAERCTVPHLTLADSPGGDGERIIAVKFQDDDLDDLEKGRVYVVTGKFARRSNDGFVRSKGLIIQESVVDPNADKDDKSKKKKKVRRKR